MPLSQLPDLLSAWLSDIAVALDRRSAPRLFLLFVGALFAKGRRTVTSWFRAAGITTEFRPAYHPLWAAGRRADALAYHLLCLALKPLMRHLAGHHALFAIDDTPTALRSFSKTFYRPSAAGWVYLLNERGLRMPDDGSKHAQTDEMLYRMYTGAIVGLNVARVLQLTDSNLERSLLAILTPLWRICEEAGLDADEVTFDVMMKAIEESSIEGDGFADRVRTVLLRMGKPDN